MTKGIRRFRSGDYRYMPSAPNTQWQARMLARLTAENKDTITWASCAMKKSKKSAFKDTSPRFLSEPRFTRNQFNGFYLSNSDLAILGLAGLALSAPLALAYSGPVYALSQFQLASTAVLTAQSISGTGPAALLGLTSGITALQGLFGGLSKPKTANMVTFKKPCSENTGDFG